jgi:glucan-binding YG repeat protein
MEDEKNLGNEENTSQEEDTSKNNESEEDSGEGDDKDAVIAKLTEERDNYKRGLLATKQKRSLNGEEKKEEEKKKPAKKVDETDQIVNKALRKMAEKQAIAEILDPDSPSHIPECVDNKNWSQIINYVPSGADKETVAGVKRAIKIAVAAWKADTGYKDLEDKSNGSDASALGGKSNNVSSSGEKPKSTLNIPKKSGIDTWFPKK